jgi:hypothetical protein
VENIDNGVLRKIVEENIYVLKRGYNRIKGKLM